MKRAQSAIFLTCLFLFHFTNFGCFCQAVPPSSRSGWPNETSSAEQQEPQTTTYRPGIQPPDAGPPSINPFVDIHPPGDDGGPLQPPVEVNNVPEDTDFSGLDVNIMDGTTEEMCNSLKQQRKNDTGKLLVTKYREVVSCIYSEMHKKFVDGAKSVHASLDPDDFFNKPPLNTTSDSKLGVNIEIEDIIVTDVDMRQTYFGASVVMTLKWRDSRLKFSPHTWAITSFELPWERRIWIPKVVRELEIIGVSYSLPKLAVPFSCAKTLVLATGDVECETDKMALRFDCYRIYLNISPGLMFPTYMDEELTFNGGEDMCEFNMRNYPDDDVKCCVSFLVSEYEDWIKLSLKNPNGIVHKNHMPKDWKMKYIRGTVRNGTVDHRGQELQICTAASRDQTNLRIQLSLPMAIASILALVSFLVPNLVLQLTLKIFALFLQFLCFKSLVERTLEKTDNDRGAGSSKLHVFYEFAIGVTIFSLLVTMICQLLHNAGSRFAGPPAICQRLAERDNGVGCFCLEPAGDKTLAPWQKVAAGLNRLAMLVVVVVFVFGVIIILAQ